MENGDDLNLVGAPTMIVGAVFLTIAFGVRQFRFSGRKGRKSVAITEINKTAYLSAGGVKTTPYLLRFSPNTVTGDLVSITDDVPNAFRPVQEIEDVVDAHPGRFRDRYYGVATRPGRYGQGHDL